jgi:hypothetical protein
MHTIKWKEAGDDLSNSTRQEKDKHKNRTSFGKRKARKYDFNRQL